MTDKELEDLKEDCRKELLILQEQERKFDRSSIKTLDDSQKYWGLRTKMQSCINIIRDYKYYPAEEYRDWMKLAVECLEHSKPISKELQLYWFDRWFEAEMDFVGEAHCKIGTMYYPRYGDLAVGEEKEIWEEVIQLGNDLFKLRPEKYE